MLLSVISPVYNASHCVKALVDGILQNCNTITTAYEVLLVDDGSTDHSWGEIEKICAASPNVRGIKLSRNFGQHHAIIAGLEEAQGNWIIVMDCDLQDNPVEIPRLFQKAQEGFSIVTASRADRKDSICKKWTSRLFWKVLSYLTGTSLDHTVANFGIYHKDVIKAICTLKESIQFFPTMVLWTGYKRTSIEVEHCGRHSGETGYSYYKMFKLAIDIILANSDKPIRIVIRIGFAISVISFLIGLYYLFLNLTNQIIVPGYTSIIISIWFLGGLTIFILGILGLYLGKTFEDVKGRPNYIIEKKNQLSRMLIKTVSWDSKFFGRKIGRITTEGFDLKTFEKEKNKFDLIYIQNVSDSAANTNWKYPFAQFEDKKLVYSKKINDAPPPAKDIIVYEHALPSNELIALALQSGEFSRFKRDTNFKKKSYEQLYTKWIQNSTNKKLAFCVLIFGDLKNPDGFITLQKKGNVAQVGLFAVNNNAQNRGIGKKLMAAAEYFAQKHNFDMLNVTTQADNKLACRLYEKCGFNIQSSINTYHYWNKKNAHTI